MLNILSAAYANNDAAPAWLLNQSIHHAYQSINQSINHSQFSQSPLLPTSVKYSPHSTEKKSATIKNAHNTLRSVRPISTVSDGSCNIVTNICDFSICMFACYCNFGTVPSNRTNTHKQKVYLLQLSDWRDSDVIIRYSHGACQGGQTSDVDRRAVVLGRCWLETGAFLYCTGSTRGWRAPKILALKKSTNDISGVFTRFRDVTRCEIILSLPSTVYSVLFLFCIIGAAATQRRWRFCAASGRSTYAETVVALIAHARAQRQQTVTGNKGAPFMIANKRCQTQCAASQGDACIIIHCSLLSCIV